MKIGIIGNGFVGGATAFGFSEYVPTYVYDKDPKKSLNSLEETINESDFIFVSVQGLGRGDDPCAIACHQTPPSLEDTTSQSRKLFVFFQKNQKVQKSKKSKKSKI